MPIARSASSSDLDLARAITRRLAPAAASPAPTPGTTGNYVRFRAGGSPPVAAAPPVLAPPPEAIAGSGGWPRLLDWACAAAGAEAAFLTDTRGLVIACRGEVTDDDAQSIGARIVIAFAHADQMDGHGSRSIAIELERRWLTGLRVPFGDEPLIVGLLASGPITDGLRAAITGAVAVKLARM